ncbi:hypothetical protein TNCV_4648661 [Trichonephila clavipes]|uniref:Uncharacterized protein n=1 Tax=Trichonephila clavipes TaxID=2585209 RepID=A0A8X6STG4_TRICX|nr:hypothetical protein TNCV_4648661 [Trichonephila clavipes]
MSQCPGHSRKLVAGVASRVLATTKDPPCSPHVESCITQSSSIGVVWKHGERVSCSVVKLVTYTRAFGDGPRNFEPMSCDEEDTRAANSSPNNHTTPTGGLLSSRQI